MTQRTHRAVSGALLILLASCSGATSPPEPGALPPVARHAQNAHSQHYIYVSAQAGSQGAVEVYSSKGQAQLPIATITSGISVPAGLAVDATGNLYVANSGNSTVTVYPPGETTPIATYSQGISTPGGVAVGSDGTVYVANETGSGSYTGTVTEYPAGSTSPSVTIALPGMYAFNVALDAANALYVSWFSLSSYGIQIYKYPNEGSNGGKNLNLDLPTGVFPAYAIAFDRSGNLVVPCGSLTHDPPKYLAVFAPGATKPKRKIQQAGLLDVVTGVAFPRWSKLFYVAAENDHDWLALTYPKAIPRDVVNLEPPTGLALSP